MLLDMVVAAQGPKIGHVVHRAPAEERNVVVRLELARVAALDTSESVSLETGLPRDRP